MARCQALGWIDSFLEELLCAAGAPPAGVWGARRTSTVQVFSQLELQGPPASGHRPSSSAGAAGCAALERDCFNLGLLDEIAFKLAGGGSGGRGRAWRALTWLS